MAGSYVIYVRKLVFVYVDAVYNAIALSSPLGLYGTIMILLFRTLKMVLRGVTMLMYQVKYYSSPLVFRALHGSRHDPQVRIFL